MSKPRPDSKLLNLPEEQQLQLSQWPISGMPYYEAKKQVEDLFHVKVAISSFTGFWNEVCEPALIARRRRAASTADEIAIEAEKRPGSFDKATIDALRQKAFELSINPNANPKDVKALFMLVLKSKDQELKGEQIQLEARRVALLEANQKVNEALNDVSKAVALDATTKQQILDAVEKRLTGE
jgi:hypothetical protein